MIYMTPRFSALNPRDDFFGRHMILAYDPIKNGIWTRESVDGHHGYSSAVVYKDFCSTCGNLFMGGFSYFRETRNKYLIISQFTDAGSLVDIFFIRSDFDGMNPFVDHMFLDNKGGNHVLFGSTRHDDPSTSAKAIYLWRVDIDYYYQTPDTYTLKIRRYTSEEGDSKIIALRPKLDFGNAHGIFYTNGAFYYFVHKWDNEGIL